MLHSAKHEPGWGAGDAAEGGTVSIMRQAGEDGTRRRVDLGRLPRWLQYLIALAVVAVVVTAAWRSGGNRPPPAWAEGPVVTALGVLFLALLAIGLGSRLLRRRVRKSDPLSNGEKANTGT